MQFRIYRDSQNQWRWRLKGNNGEILATGEGYHNRQDCLECVRLVQHSSTAEISIEP